MNGLEADEPRGRSSLLFMIVDLEGRIKSLHPGWEDLLGWERRKMRERPILDFIHPEDRDTTRDALQQLGRGGAVRDFRNRYLTRDGDVVHLEWQALLDPERDLVYGAAEDVTRRVALEEPLHSQEARYRALFERSRDAIVHADARGRIVGWNPGAESMFGWTLEEIGGEPLTRIMPERYRKMHEMGMRRFHETGEERALGEDALQVHGLRKDGSEFPLEMTLGAWTRDGERYYGAIIRDITERLETEDELRREKRYVELLQRVAMASNEAESIREAFHQSVEAIATTIGWPLGHVYLRDPDDANLLRPTGIWYDGCEAPCCPLFREVTETTLVKRGEGLVGRILESGHPAWIANVHRDPNFPRADRPGMEDVRTGFGFPVRVEGEVVGVLEFFHTEPMEPDEHLLEVMDPIGAQLGLVVDRMGRFEEMRRALEQLDP